ncbi:uncharacterized protein FOMMEDRAFT_165129 [Fomitiporia mediterranea MF3/22]|uniref:uncharacterized protein n=1 Tax=Fomitiporia mediterranea (strain MF3/22) TaxID=694068 RepID=UPI0004408A46|nr:uncharacterized protein FOMMEDRAFT_165129 [Fomitiporia mediterranea MF3/22]EJD08580.1 hypothetical protein FOMMEDRAFT_165129 [Fomitiporia mediterranea MF3/22]
MDCSGFKYPIFEDEYDEDPSTFKAPRGVQPAMQNTPVRSVEQAHNNGCEVQKKKLSALGYGRKSTVYMRIDGVVQEVEIQCRDRSCHVQSINGLPLNQALYTSKTDGLPLISRLDKLKSDKDLDLEDSEGRTVRCKSCKKCMSGVQMHTWIEHKIRCEKMQQKLKDEFQKRMGNSLNGGTYTSSRKSNVEQRQPLRVNKRRRRNGYRKYPTNQNQKVSVQIGDTVKIFQYDVVNNRIMLDGKTLAEVFYGIKLDKHCKDRSELFKSDPDIESFSNVFRTCVCRGCNETISTKYTYTWLEHRFRCPLLQKHRALVEDSPESDTAGNDMPSGQPSILHESSLQVSSAKRKRVDNSSPKEVSRSPLPTKKQKKAQGNLKSIGKPTVNTTPHSTMGGAMARDSSQDLSKQLVGSVKALQAVMKEVSKLLEERVE